MFKQKIPKQNQILKNPSKKLPKNSKHRSHRAPSHPLTLKKSVSTISTRKMSSSPDSSPEMRSKIKIYTKTGDKGTTQLYNMDRLPKNVDFFEALGNTDEANSTLGLAREYFLHIPAVQKIKNIVIGKKGGGFKRKKMMLKKGEKKQNKKKIRFFVRKKKKKTKVRFLWV